MSGDYRVIVCGGRDPMKSRFAELLYTLLVGLAERHGQRLVVVNGNARGVDSMADKLARQLGIRTDPFPADWNGRGRIAGHERNQRMLDAGAELVVAFKHPFNWALDRGGTEDMVRRAKLAMVPTFVIEGPV